jgi:hypothetical protein
MTPTKVDLIIKVIRAGPECTVKYRFIIDLSHSDLLLLCDEVEQLRVRVGELMELLQSCEVAAAEDAKDAIAIMDEKGSRNPEGNSMELWEKDWNVLRDLLVQITEITNG